MSGGQLSGVIQYLRKVAGAPDPGGPGDGPLLERFVTRQDEAAFDALMRRHGPMVLGTCLRILNNMHDAEDAFQATFLVLARKAGAIANRESVGSWLHRIASRTAQRARVEASRRHAHEGPITDMPAAADAIADLAWQELRPVLDDELTRLSEKYRGPVVLCYLQEKTYAQAAEILGLPEGTVSSRLARARDVLRKRLSRRGLALSSGLLATLLSQRALSAAIPIHLISSTTKAALQFAAGKLAAAGIVSAHVAALSEGVLQAMRLTTLKIAVSVILAVGVLATGGGLLTHQVLAQKQASVQKEEAPKLATQKPPEAQPKPKPFENEFGYSWAWAPQKLDEIQPDTCSMWGMPGALACSFAEGQTERLVMTFARAVPKGSWELDYRPVAFDAERKRCPLCQNAACGTSAEQGVGLFMAIWVSACPAGNVKYVGVEVLKQEGRKAIAARAIERAKEAGIDVLPPARIGEIYEFTLTSMNGKRIRAADLRGKVVLIDCWSTTCSPCMEKMPKLKALFEKHQKDGFEIIGVNLDQDPEKAENAIQAQGLTWPQVHVPSDEKTREVWYGAAELRSVPRLLLIDREGRLRADCGPDQLEAEISKLLDRSTEHSPRQAKQ
jgi:RNA polymerase sigma factor (sigma-70 family)